MTEIGLETPDMDTEMIDRALELGDPNETALAPLDRNGIVGADTSGLDWEFYENVIATGNEGDQ